MEQYGAFAKIIANLESSLAQIRTTWTDSTAQTYDCINENMQYLAIQISDYEKYSDLVYKQVKDNYNEGDFEDTINQMYSKVVAV